MPGLESGPWDSGVNRAIWKEISDGVLGDTNGIKYQNQDNAMAVWRA